MITKHSSCSRVQQFLIKIKVGRTISKIRKCGDIIISAWVSGTQGYRLRSFLEKSITGHVRFRSGLILGGTVRNFSSRITNYHFHLQLMFQKA